MVQGDAYNIDVTIRNHGEPVTADDVEAVEITLLSITRLYPGDVTYSDGKFHFPVSQEETFRLPAICPMQVRVKYAGGDVVGSQIQTVNVASSISKVVL